jgi:tRNA uridine 5-carboxymethylaminomethyl modification enzyme
MRWAVPWAWPPTWAGIQFRVLNARKGPAVRATRAQADRNRYKAAIRGMLETQPNLTLFQQAAGDLIVAGTGDAAWSPRPASASSPRPWCCAPGTFLGGRDPYRSRQSRGGRAGDPPSGALAERLRALPFRVDRLKTGTPPRLDAKSLDFSRLEEQPGDDPDPGDVLLGTAMMHPRQVSCHIAHTNERTHEIILANLHRFADVLGRDRGGRSALLPVHRGQGAPLRRQGEPPDVRRAGRARHPGALPQRHLHLAALRRAARGGALDRRGLENAFITRPGYAIEYDFFDPRDLHPLAGDETFIHNLFFAGQINGTTGYEEAGAQGLLAGLNAARSGRRPGGRGAPARRGLPGRAGRRPDHPGHEARALPHVHLAGRIPPAAARGQCRPAPHAGPGANWASGR